MSLLHHFHFLAPSFSSALVFLEEKQSPLGLVTSVDQNKKYPRGISSGVLCIAGGRDGVGSPVSTGVVVRVVPGEGQFFEGTVTRAGPLPMIWRRGFVRLSWPGASGKHSLTLSLTPKPASTEISASPSLSHHAAHQLGIRRCSKQPVPCREQEHKGRVVWARVARGESCTMGGVGEVRQWGSQAPGLDVPAPCHPSHPSQPHSKPLYAPFHPRSALAAPRPWSQLPQSCWHEGRHVSVSPSDH